MIAIIDYNIGNVSSILNMLNRLGIPARITSSASEIDQAEKIILPGNGSFDACMKNLKASGLISFLEKQVWLVKKPLLGICVGAQMLGHGSAEGHESGLGWIDMLTMRFPEMPDLRIPHMGWGQVNPVNKINLLTKNMDLGERFYFVHSYYMQPKDSDDIILTAHYGIDFAAGIGNKNIFGVQFHPEKSHRFGKQLLAAFAGG